MKLVKYISMLLVVLISNWSCSSWGKKDTGKLNSIPIDNISFQINDSRCKNLEMFALPTNEFTPGSILLNNSSQGADLISNSTAYTDYITSFPLINTEKSKEFDAGIFVNFLNKRLGASITANYNNSQKVKIKFSLKNPSIVVLKESDITNVILKEEMNLLNADFSESVPALYKCIIYADGIDYKLEQTDNSKSEAGFTFNTIVLDVNPKVADTEVTKISLELKENFSGGKRPVLFSKVNLSKQEIIKQRDKNPPVISYRANTQDRGCGPQDQTSEDKDGSHANQITPYPQQISLFSFKLSNHPRGCSVIYTANTGKDSYSDGSRAGNQSCPDFIEKIRAKLEGCPKDWNVNYRVNSRRPGSDSGLGDWQPWKCNDDWSGVDGRKIVAMEAKITTNSECLR
jgi:hypothetical protein